LERIGADERLSVSADHGLLTLTGEVAYQFQREAAYQAVNPDAAITETSNRASLSAAEDDVQKSLITSGFEPILDSGPEATRAFIAEETARWVPIMKATNFKME